MGKIVLCEEKHEVSTASAEQRSRKRTTGRTVEGVYGPGDARLLFETSGVAGWPPSGRILGQFSH